MVRPDWLGKGGGAAAAGSRELSSLPAKVTVEIDPGKDLVREVVKSRSGSEGGRRARIWGRVKVEAYPTRVKI